MTDITEYKKLIVMGCAYYGMELKDFVVEMYAKDLSDLPFENVVQALDEIKLDKKVSRFPFPALIRDKIAPVRTTENIGLETANEILTAISDYGWPNFPQAKEKLSSLALDVIEKSGGWAAVCRNANAGDVNTYRAQLRDFSEARMISRKTESREPKKEIAQNQDKLRLIATDWQKGMA